MPLPVITSFVTGAMLSVLNWWLDAGRPYPPEQIDTMFQQLAMNGVEKLLQTSKQQPRYGRDAITHTSEWQLRQRPHLHLYLYHLLIHKKIE